MKDCDKKQFAALMEGLGSIYDTEYPKTTLGIWFGALVDNSIEEVSQAVQSYIKSPDFGTFKPKPADIIKMINGTAKDAAHLAWTKMDQAVRCVGTHSSVVFDDPIIHRVIEEMGGWISFGEKKETEWPFIAKEFKERYTGYKNRDEIPECHGKLIGQSEASNNQKGFGAKEPILIGDAEKAKIVFLGGHDKPQIGFTQLPADEWE